MACCRSGSPRALCRGSGRGVLAVRSFLARPGVFVKIDVSNAFNSISRAAIGDAVARHSPLLGGYFVAAYAEPTHLFWGECVISSSCGVQQGAAWIGIRVDHRGGSGPRRLVDPQAANPTHRGGNIGLGRPIAGDRYGFCGTAAASPSRDLKSSGMESPSRYLPKNNCGLHNGPYMHVLKTLRFPLWKSLEKGKIKWSMVRIVSPPLNCLILSC